MLSKTNWLKTLSLCLLSADTVRSAHLGKHAREMFDQSMDFLDEIYDPNAGYWNYFYYPFAAGPHETRSSIWYSLGLLQRNHGHDVAEAWYGDYTVYPEQPTVGTGPYGAEIYDTWDPNWRGFIDTALIIVYEEYGHLLPKHVKELVLESVKNSTIGDTYRVWDVDSDNLSPSYSNPWLMRAMASSWTGLKIKDSNMTIWGDKWTQEFLDLFDRNQTLSEFNGPTYAGVDLYALTLAAKYLGHTDTLIGRNAPRLIEEIWDCGSLLWNPNLRNLAGPWDRTYGFDMNNYVAIMSLWIWSLVGKEYTFVNKVVGGSVNAEPSVQFCGLTGGACEIIHNFEFWKLTFSMPEGSTEAPSIHLKFT